MSFIGKIAQNRLQARQLGQVDGPKADDAKGAQQGQPLEGPALRPGGRPVQKNKAGGLNQAMMRQTIADVFAAGEKLGLTGPLLARHLASVDRIGGDIRDLEIAMVRGLGKQPAETQAVFKNLPAQLIGEMSKGLQALDPAGSAKSISNLIGTVTDLVQGKLPNGEQLRAIIGISHAAGQLESGDMGKVVRTAAGKITKVGLEGTGLNALVQQMGLAMGAITGVGAAREELFGVAFDTMTKALNGDGDVTDIANAANKAAGGVLNEGQVKIAIDQANKARALKGQLDNQVKQAEQQLAQATQVYDGKLAGAEAGKLQPLAGLREQVGAMLSPKGQAIWHHQMNTHAAQPDHVVQALGQFLFTYLARVGREAIPDAVVQKAAQQFVALCKVDGVGAEHLQQIASEHAGAVDHAELPGTLTQLTDILAQLTPDARGKLLGAGPVEADGSLAMTALANTLGSHAERYAQRDGPKASLVAALNTAPNKETLALVARRGVRFAAEIPNGENGGIVDRLRGHFPEDMAILAQAGIDPATVAAANPVLPGDSVVRLLAIGVQGKRDTDQWLADLEKFFKGARGNKEHARNMRTLLAATADAGVDATKLVDAFKKSGMSDQVLTKTVQALLDESGFAPTKEYLDEAIKTLNKGGALLEDIQGRLQTKLMQEMNLGQLVGDAKVKVTDRGLAAVKGPLAQFFKSGVGQRQVPQELLQGFLVAVLEDKTDAFRFGTPAAAHQLKSLSPDAKKAWMDPQVMMHVRFEGEGEARFKERVGDSAKLGQLLLGRMEEAWGKLDDLLAKQAELVGKLRNVDKNDRKARAPLVREMRGLPAKIKGLEWAGKVAGMTPENITPTKFLALGDELMDMRSLVGPAGEAAIDALQHTLKMTDISYSQVVTDDGPDFTTTFPLATTNCLKWPGDGAEVLGYAADPNKRFIVTKNQAGELRRSVMRLVERQDEGHVGEPMLMLERTYPDRVTEEEKQRLMEHVIRRAAAMGVACGFATEYYWDASKTGRRQIIDMNKVLEDLSGRYNSAVDKKIMQVVNPAGNFECDYLDSAPRNGAAGRGQVGIRRYKGNEDTKFENEFIVMTPK